MSSIIRLTSQVKHNCNISDAKFWGFYSPCGLLLRLRDLYHFENHLKPWHIINEKHIRTWIGKRETLWNELEAEDYRPINIKGRNYNPFDMKNINRHINKNGYMYSAGYGNSLKPIFLLARLSRCSENGRYTVYTAGDEIARDLSTFPAMINGNTIITRMDTASLFFWHKLEEMKAMRCDSTLHQAFSAYGIERGSSQKISLQTLKKRIQNIVNDELTAYVNHEIGEASQRRYLGKWWKELTINLPHSRAELFVRGLKDVLADTCQLGMLTYIIQNRKAGSLSFYITLLGGYRKLILNKLTSAYNEFRDTHDWNIIEEARIQEYRKAKLLVKQLKELYDSGTASAQTIEMKLIPII